MATLSDQPKYDISLKLLGILLFGMTLSACSLIPLRYSTIELEGGYQMVIPDYMDPMISLNEQANIQYGNPYKEMFLIVQYQSWDDLTGRYPDYVLEDYYDFHAENLLLSLQEPEAPGPDSVQIGTCWALDGHIQGMFKGDEIYYRLVVIHAVEGLYQLLAWTPIANLEASHQDMDQMIYSFAEQAKTEPPILDEEIEGDSSLSDLSE